MRRLLLLLALPLALGLPAALTGCSGAEEATYESAQQAYLQGMQHYEQRRYRRAAETLQRVFDFGRTSEQAADAQFYLARALFEDGDYALAGGEFTRFMQLYPDDARVEEAEYGRVQAYARLSPPVELDQTDTERAIEYVRLFINRYPNSVYAPDVGGLLDELQEKLALKQLNAGRLYQRRELYEAAAISYLEVLDRFPTSQYADDALLGAAESYLAYGQGSILVRQSERFEQAIATYNRMVDLFPGSPLLPQAQEVYDEAYTALQEAQARLAELEAARADDGR